MGDGMFAALLLLLTGFFLAVMGEWCVRLVSAANALELEKAKRRMLEGRLERTTDLLIRTDKAYRETVAAQFRACQCGAAAKLSYPPALPPSPAPGFAARRKGEGRDA